MHLQVADDHLYRTIGYFYPTFNHLQATFAGLQATFAHFQGADTHVNSTFAHLIGANAFFHQLLGNYTKLKLSYERQIVFTSVRNTHTSFMAVEGKMGFLKAVEQ